MFKVKIKVTIEFFVEIYFRNDLHFFEKYFTWGNIQPSRDFLDTLYTSPSALNNRVGSFPCYSPREGATAQILLGR